MKRSQVAKICSVCNCSFSVKQSHSKRRVYCTRECMSEGYKVRMIGVNNPNKGFLRLVKLRECPVCFTSFKTYSKRKTCGNKVCIQSQISRSKGINFRKFCPVCNSKFMASRKTCSISCRKILRETSRKKNFKSKKFQNSKLKTCIVCNNGFRKYFSKKVCSKECLRIHKRNTQLGSKSHLWRGGKTSDAMLIRGSLDYAIWRDSVFVRDNYTCALCSRRGTKLAAHHIKQFAKHPDLRLTVSNGITLCWDCHSKIRGSEEKLESYFTEIVKTINTVQLS